MALKTMLKDADVMPGDNEEIECRGGLPDYNQLGYVSTRYLRSGTRTVEYAYDDFAIATVAKGLGDTAIAERFFKQANNWTNLWRDDYQQDGSSGLIFPKDASGKWVDNIVATKQGHEGEIIPFTAAYVNIGKFEDWWSGFLYEGRSWEYSFSVPHDVAGIIERRGGSQAFERKLDTLFDKHYFYVGNEPGFIAPKLYHWLGKPVLSSSRIHGIVDHSCNDSASSIPGNDDPGAMSAWLAFHMLGIYPNAGQSYCLINTPYFAERTLHLPAGKTFKIIANNLGPKNQVIAAATFIGSSLNRAWIEHADIVPGGVLELEMSDHATGWGHDELPPSLSQR